MRPRPLSRAAVGALIASCSLAGQAGQLRSIADGVYSAGQAARGRQIYTARCAECHGRAMEGTSGPPLAGPRFLARWSARPVAGLADKIQKTMPFNLVTDLSSQESIDLVAAILEAGKFPAGAAELNAPALTQVAFPAAAPVAESAANTRASTLLPPEGS